MTPAAQRKPESELPLTEPEFHILLTLTVEPMHGYGIIVAVEAATEGRLRLRTGTLYTAIRRMVESGLVEETAAPTSAAHDDPRRKYYRIMAFGRAVARAEARRVESLAGLARTRGLLPLARKEG
jgi:DNA-binding PadR family transcriptional regulator